MKTSILYILIAVQAGILSCAHIGPTYRKVAVDLDAPPVNLINEGALQLYKEGKFFIIQQCKGNTALNETNQCEKKAETKVVIVPLNKYAQKLKQELVGSGKLEEVINRVQDFSTRYADENVDLEIIEQLKTLQSSVEIKDQVGLFVDQVINEHLQKFMISSGAQFFDFNILTDYIKNSHLFADFIKIKSGVCKIPKKYSANNSKGLNPEQNYTSAFEIQSTAVTQAQYYSIIGAVPSYFTNKRYCNEEHFVAGGMSFCPNNPVEQVSWKDADGFVDKLNEIDKNYKYSLPTETELDCAIRAGTNTAYWFGDDASQLQNYAWYEANSESRTHAVGTCPNKEVDCKNPWGLYDAHGNVWQWVSDSFSITNKAMLGGSYNYNENALRADYRHSNDKRGHVKDVGFRLVRKPRN